MELKCRMSFEASSIVNATQTHPINYSTETGSTSSILTTTTIVSNSNEFSSESIIQPLDANNILKNESKATLIVNNLKLKMDKNSTNTDDESIKPQSIISTTNINKRINDLTMKSNDDMLNSTNKKVKFKYEPNQLRANLSLDVNSLDYVTTVNTQVLDKIPSDYDEAYLVSNESVNRESLSSCDLYQKNIVIDYFYILFFKHISFFLYII